MLDDLARTVAPAHFVARLNDKRFENAIPAEAELGLVWAVDSLGGFESEPAWFSAKGKRPEGISTAIVPGFSTVFDVKAISDRVTPANVGMRKASRKLMETANKVRKASGNSLDFFFGERRDYEVLKYHRSAWAPVDYEVTEPVSRQLGDFIRSSPNAGDFVDLYDKGLAVRVTWKPDAFPLFNYRSSIVDEIFDIDNNHIASALRDKARQMRSPTFEGLRAVLLADIGCASLRRIDGMDALGRSVSGRKIIQHALDHSKGGLDFVCVFSPQSESRYFGGTRHWWQVTLIVRSELNIPDTGLRSLAAKLPEPRFDGYSLEHLHEQRMFEGQTRGWYLGPSMTTGNDKLKARFSARALHEFLAGRIDEGRLRDSIIGGAGAFEYQLASGNCIQSAQIIPGGIDEDDDYIELVFQKDPAAASYELNKGESSD